MAYINMRVRSILLQRTMNVDLYFPTDLPAEIVPKVNGVVTLLTGYGGTGADFMNWSAMPRYAADNGLILVAPDCDNSFYTDMAAGGPFYTYLTEELPSLLGGIFRLPEEREKNFIAGISMGGYGALLAGLSSPERYAGIASLSGAINPAYMRTLPGMSQLFSSVFEEDKPLPERYDLTKLLQNTARLPKAQQPKVFCCAGKQDEEGFGILSQNRSFSKELGSLSDSLYMEWDGNHEWKFWDRGLVYAVDYFLGNGYAAQKLNDWQCDAQIL